ncbi:MAG: class I SAM-dependent methyltransferase [Steroidobacteraceae bacterium]
MPVTAPPASEDELSGRSLYGDSFSPAQIEQWYETEVSGYFDLITTHYKIADEENKYDYEYAALNRFHAIGSLLNRKFDTCVALGCAAGTDIEPLAPVVRRFVAIEPAEKWWRSEIGGKPAQFLKPTVLGDIPLADGSADLAASFGVLHHIPNVSHVVGEIARILAPGGLFVLREPICSMGDWRKARPGLTANERGLPIEWFDNLVKKTGFRIVARRPCMFNPLIAIGKKLGFPTPLSVMPIVVLDSLICRAMQWNVRYWRESFFRKLAPSSAFWILERTGG